MTRRILKDLAEREAFARALSLVFHAEGGESHDPQDPGGLTRFGIAQRYHPDVDVATLTKPAAERIYWTTYWLPARGWLLELPEDVRQRAFLLLVHANPRDAQLVLQRALRACGSPVTEDGIAGPETLGAVATVARTAWGAAQLLAAYRSEAAGYYRVSLIVQGRTERYLAGFLRRAYL